MTKENKEIFEEEELSLDDLAEVTGGAGMRKVKKEKTEDISDDTIGKL
jgi:hypothetical protein